MKRRKLVAPNGPGHRVKPCSGVQNERAPDLRTEAHSFRNAQDETRTRKGRSPADFESAASTNSATQAGETKLRSAQTTQCPNYAEAKRRKSQTAQRQNSEKSKRRYQPTRLAV